MHVIIVYVNKTFVSRI